MPLFRRETKPRRMVLALLPLRSVGAEIGVWKGDFSRSILRAARPKTLHLIDPWIVSTAEDRAATAWYGSAQVDQPAMDALHDAVLRRFQRPIATRQVVVHRGDFAAAGLAECSLDYVYIDGDHSYAGVSADLAVAARVVRPGGLIACDDYRTGSWWGDGSVRAVHDFLAAHPATIVLKIDAQIVLRLET